MHPVNEVLAALIEGRLSSHARRQVMEHVAMCGECHSILQSARDLRVAEPERRRDDIPWRRVAVALTAATFVIAILAVTWLRESPFRSSHESTALLAAAKRLPFRSFEGRLSADFPYRPVVLSRGSAKKETLAVAIEALRIKSFAEQGAIEPRTLAAAHLFLQEWDEAQKTLADEVGDPNRLDADLLNDLAVASFEAGRRLDRPWDLESAHEAVDRAWRLERKPPIAFNRALILEKLELRIDAAEAWRDYLKLDSTSEWAGEARRHLAMLSEPTRSEKWIIVRDSGDIDAAAREFPQQLREYIHDTILPRWCRAVLSGDQHSMTAAMRVLRDAAATSQDPVIRDLVPSPEHDRAIAEALAVFTALEPRSKGAAAEYLRAGDVLRAKRNGFADVAVQRAAGAMTYADDHAGSLSTARDLMIRTRSPSTRALAARLAGLNEHALGRPFEALTLYRQSLTEFQRIREWDHAAAALNLIAEALDYLGDNEEAARRRYQARSLIAAEGALAPRLLHVLNAAGRQALDRGHYRTADLFLRRQIEVAEARNHESLLINGLLWRGVVLVRRGSVDEGWASVREAAARAERIPSSRADREHVLSNVHYVQAVALTDKPPAERLHSIDEALRFATKSRNNFRAASLWLERGRVSRAVGHSSDAEESFRRGIELLTDESRTVAADEFRGRHFDARRELYEEWIALALTRDPGDAFSIADELKTRVFRAGSPAGTRERPVAHESRLKPNHVLVAYAVLPDRLAVWSLRRGGSTFATVPIARNALALLVTKFVTSLREGRTRDSAALGAALSQALLAPVRVSLEGAASVTFVPDGPLGLVPFGALPIGSGRLLIEQSVVAMSPSCATYFEPVPDARETPRVLAIGDPAFDRSAFPDLDRLPAAVQEAEAIGRIYPGAVVVTGDRATTARLEEGCAGFDIVTFAGHSVTNDEHPERSALVLAPHGNSGVVYVSQLRKTSCLARLVVLASCASALQRTNNATSASLATSVIAAGAGAVIGTLWDLPDASARVLMVPFHRRVAAGQSAASALRESQLDAMRAGQAGWEAFRISGRSAAF
jgi:CHAT domain-containing protein/tetratricopeptide (TPR) repeat protein